MPAPAEVTLPSDTQIRIVRDFDAPRSLVYLAFTEPALVRRWLTVPPGWSMPICEIDLRVGGDYHYRWENDGGRVGFGARGTFEAIAPGASFTAREHFEDTGPSGEAHIVTTFDDHGKGTRVAYLITAESPEARAAALASGMTNGMEMSFAMLAGVLAQQAAANGA